MVKILHILNSDSSASIFKKTELWGEVLVWREMLCEGSLHKNIGSDAFWKQRYSFFEKEVGIAKLDYYDNTIKEIIPIEDLEGYEEVVLWFDFDLFCQINLIGLCTYLLQSYRKDIRYYLVCTGKEKGSSTLQALSDYTVESYIKLYENRIKISRNDLLFAQESWNLFVSNNPTVLRAFNFNKNKKFRYLQNAINQHLERFPKLNSLNQIENKILETIALEPITKKEIISKLQLWQKEKTVYGFGDLNYLLVLQKLSDYYKEEEEGFLELNDLGKNIML